jgi:transposase
LSLRVRRFVCSDTSCPRRTFAEQIAGLTRRYGHRTERARSALVSIGLALAGRAGSRLASLLGMAAGRDTLLRLVIGLPDPPVTAPRVVGVDDFATRRGHRYGTVIIDGETHEVLDVLPGRDAATLAPWLAAHPGIEVICRDRSGAYAEAAATAAPDATQVADRYHLWQNLGQAVEKCVAAHRDRLAIPAPAPEPGSQPPATGPEAVGSHGTGRLAARLQAHHALVHQLLDQGMGIRAIARHLGWGRHTVQRSARADP